MIIISRRTYGIAIAIVFEDGIVCSRIGSTGHPGSNSGRMGSRDRWSDISTLLFEQHICILTGQVVDYPVARRRGVGTCRCWILFVMTSSSIKTEYLAPVRRQFGRNRRKNSPQRRFRTATPINFVIGMNVDVVRTDSRSIRNIRQTIVQPSWKNQLTN